ncbi:lysophospholipase catalytic domain-containing protein [Cercophora newfieldiana]|uniref:Lysophospholipase n=1 Tax=Cercophora newfieldiana TaxID=92897 RepID=A0AA40CYS9_9PEZI|nr:lysophospholipase catalytic domain-containing protein [Cercophora newfieldiana]
MHLPLAIPAAAALLNILAASAEPIPLPFPHDVSVDRRALPNAPSGGYAPAVVPCPATKPTVRGATGLSPNETSWLALRRKETVEPMIDFLKRAAIPGFDAEAYIRAAASNISALPNIAIAASGGGYRALMNGGGFVAAADSRTPGSTSKGGIGGLLQSSTYLAGLSGGGWMVGSVMLNNFSTIVQLRDGFEGSSVYQFSSSIFRGPKERGLSVLNTASYWDDIIDQVQEKRDAGYNTSLTDFWGRALSYQLINAPLGGPSYTFSSIALTDEFAKAKTPFPILVADGRLRDDSVVTLNATVYEFNPFEMGSFDPTVRGFVPTEYIGSNFSNGAISNDGKCVRGLDSASFVMGTSSSLFNIFILQNISAVDNIPGFVADTIVSILTDIDDGHNDVAQWTPNPFYNYNPSTNPTASTTELSLVDGGLDLQNIPLTPLISPYRAVDVIFAIDSSADTPQNWPNATALRATYDRSLLPIANGTLFPPVPDAHTFVNLGLNSQPTFFGCSPSNFTLLPGQTLPPLIVYVPNAPYTAMSNVSTFTSTYSDSQRNDIIRNGYDVATQGNGTFDSEWQMCVACAILSRSLHRAGTPAPSACESCFSRYCWNGTIDSEDKGPYLPTFKIGNGTTVDSGAGRVGLSFVSVLAALGVAAVLVG